MALERVEMAGPLNRIVDRGKSKDKSTEFSLVGPSLRGQARLQYTSKGQPKICFLLKDCVAVQPLFSFKKHKIGVFQVLLNGGATLVLAAPSDDARKRWVDNISTLAFPAANTSDNAAVVAVSPVTPAPATAAPPASGPGVSGSILTGPRASAPAAMMQARENSNYISVDEHVFDVVVKPTPDAQRLRLFSSNSNARVVVTTVNITLKDSFSDATIFSWPLRYLRRYGQSTAEFCIEAGRRCGEGEGTFHFGLVDPTNLYALVDQYSKLISQTAAISGERDRAASGAPTKVPTVGSFDVSADRAGYAHLPLGRADSVALYNVAGGALQRNPSVASAGADGSGYAYPAVFSPYDNLSGTGRTASVSSATAYGALQRPPPSFGFASNYDNGSPTAGVTYDIARHNSTAHRGPTASGDAVAYVDVYQSLANPLTDDPDPSYFEPADQPPADHPAAPVAGLVTYQTVDKPTGGLAPAKTRPNSMYKQVDKTGK